MTSAEFKAIRLHLGLTQVELASVLGYSIAMQISEIERATNSKPVPRHVAMLMKAFDAGYRPDNWPKQRKR